MLEDLCFGPISYKGFFFQGFGLYIRLCSSDTLPLSPLNVYVCMCPRAREEKEKLIRLGMHSLSGHNMNRVHNSMPTTPSKPIGYRFAPSASKKCPLFAYPSPPPPEDLSVVPPSAPRTTRRGRWVARRSRALHRVRNLDTTQALPK